MNPAFRESTMNFCGAPIAPNAERRNDGNTTGSLIFDCSNADLGASDELTISLPLDFATWPMTRRRCVVSSDEMANAVSTVSAFAPVIVDIGFGMCLLVDASSCSATTGPGFFEVEIGLDDLSNIFRSRFVVLLSEVFSYSCDKTRFAGIVAFGI